MRNIGKGLLFTSPWLVGFCAFTLVPAVLCFYYSFCDYSILQPGGPVYHGLDNYRTLLHDPIFRQSLRNTLYYAAMALPAGMMVSLGLALLLNMKTAGQGIYRTIIFLPALVPTAASAMLWLWLFNFKLGLINHVLSLVGIRGPNWLGAPGWAMPALAFMSLWGVGHTVVIYLAGLQDVPRELYEASDIDGVNSWQRFWNVTVPMISPVIFFNLIMGIIGTMQYFTLAQIMTGGNPDRATYFFTMFLYDNAFVFLHMGYASAMAWVLLVIILALTAVAFWSSRKWVHYQGK